MKSVASKTINRRLYMYRDIKDQILKCSECGKEFVFKGSIKKEDIKYNPSSYSAEDLLRIRNELDDLLEHLNNQGKNIESIIIEERLNRYERILVDSTDGNTVEAYNYFGLMYYPERCPDCRKKIRTLNK